MKTKLLKYIRKNFRLIKEVREKDTLYYWEEKTWIFWIIPDWDRYEHTYHSTISFGSAQDAIDSFLKDVKYNYYRYTRKHRNNTISKEKIWHINK